MIRIILTFCFLIPICLNGQTLRTRNVIGITPVGNRQVTINGLAIGLMAIPGKVGKLRVNGLNIELLPVAVLTIPGATFFTMLNVFPGLDHYAKTPEKVRTTINGLSVSGGMFEEIEMHGVSFNINSYVSFSKGLEMSLWMNSNYKFSGAQFSLWGNRAVEGKGFQLGLFNSCQNCKVFQIGLLNRIGNRVLPLINFDFKKR